MKITRVETQVVTLPMVIAGATPRLRDRAVTSIDVLLVRIDTDEGISGWGESFGHRIFPATRAAIDTVLGPMCVGREATQIAAIHDDLQRLLHGIGRNGPTIYALSGIDIALWDIAGKVAGLPLYRLLGGGPRADLPAYASLLRYGDAKAVAFYTEQALKRGYRDIKLHEVTLPEVKAARDDAGRDVRRHGGAALRVLRPGPAGLDPLHRSHAGRDARGALLLRFRRESAGRRDRSRQRADRGAAGAGTRRGPRSAHAVDSRTHTRPPMRSARLAPT